MLPANVRLNFKIGMLIALVAVACRGKSEKPVVPPVPPISKTAKPTVAAAVVVPEVTEPSTPTGTYTMGIIEVPSTRGTTSTFSVVLVETCGRATPSSAIGRPETADRHSRSLDFGTCPSCHRRTDFYAGRICPRWRDEYST